MATQSLAMGEAFGLGFQYGKRRISAMSNEEFNKITPVKLHQDMQGGVQAMIPEMKQSISNFTMLQTDIIKELVHYASNIINESPELVREFLGLGKSGTGGISGDVLGNLMFEILKGLTGGLITNPLPPAYGEHLPPPTNVPDDKGGKFDDFNKKLAELDRIRQQQEAAARQAPADAELIKFKERLPTVTSKRKASQSQINEQKRLIDDIATKGRQLKSAYDGERAASNPGQKAIFTQRIKLLESELLALQKLLVALLERYAF